MSEPSSQIVNNVDLDSLVVQVEGLDLDEKPESNVCEIVYKVSVDGKDCFAKKLCDILNHVVKHYSEQSDSVLRKYYNDCYTLSQLKHPNVIDFVGVHYGCDRNDISLIVERLHCDLADFIKKNPDTGLCDQLHILYDVSKGLDYLHSLSSPLIHCNVTVPNILLTEDLTAKIGDLGLSRYIDPSMAMKMTNNPDEILFYMSPECRHGNSAYTIQSDIFSFGNLIIHTIIGYVPERYMYSYNLRDLDIAELSRKGTLELMRRDHALHEAMGETHCLYPIIIRCLRDSPEQRPPVGEVRSS